MRFCTNQISTKSSADLQTGAIPVKNKATLFQALNSFVAVPWITVSRVMAHLRSPRRSTLLRGHQLKFQAQSLPLRIWRTWCGQYFQWRWIMLLMICRPTRLAQRQRYSSCPYYVYQAGPKLMQSRSPSCDKFRLQHCVCRLRQVASDATIVLCPLLPNLIVQPKYTTTIIKTNWHIPSNSGD